VEFRQEVTFGPGSSLKPAVVRRRKCLMSWRRLTLSGEPGFSASDVREALELREGDRFDFASGRAIRDRVRRFYHDRGYYAVHVTPTRQVGDPRRSDARSRSTIASSADRTPSSK
jgi:hypothetical protein